MIAATHSDGHVTWLFTRLNRYADDLPDNYREQADPLLAKAVASSFMEHIEEYIADRSAGIRPIEAKGKCPTIELRAENGAEARIEFYGNEAFDLWYTVPGGHFTDEGNLRLGTVWTHLDRSGLSFLTHMFVDESRIEVPESPQAGGNAN